MSRVEERKCWEEIRNKNENEIKGMHIVISKIANTSEEVS